MTALLSTSRQCSQRSQRGTPPLSRTVAQLRRRQLELAMAGRIIESARCAEQLQNLLQRSC